MTALFQILERPSWKFLPSKIKVRWALIAFFALYIGSLFLAGCLAPLVYKAVWAWHDFYPNSLNTYLLKKAFSIYVDRLRWIPLLIGFPFLIRAVGLWSKKNLNPAQTTIKQQTLPFFLLGIGFVILIGIVQGLNGIVEWEAQKTIDQSLFLFSKALVGALFLAFVEEIVFRGFIFRVFYANWRPFYAMLFSALFFAYVHFKAPRDSFSSIQEPGFIEGIKVSWQMLIGPAFTAKIIPFLNLFALGLAFNSLYLRTGSLLSCIFLHGGIVWASLTYKHLVDTISGTDSLFWGSARGIDSLFTLLLIGILAILFLSKRADDLKDKQEPPLRTTNDKYQALK